LGSLLHARCAIDSVPIRRWPGEVGNNHLVSHSLLSRPSCTRPCPSRCGSP